MESAITEVVDEKNNPVKIGETGRHITTEIRNLAMPFIRYDTKDLIVPDHQKDLAGRNLFNIDKIIGRESDILIAPDGNLLIVHLFTIYFEYFKSIEQFQVEQTDKYSFIFRLVVNENFSKNEEKKIYDYWKSFLGNKSKLNIEIHDNIPLLFSGKRRFLIRNKEILLP
jgi:phenylacetate-CoA ligase